MSARAAVSAIPAVVVILALGEPPLAAQPVEIVLVPDVAITVPDLPDPLLDRQALRERLAEPHHRRTVAGLPTLPDGIALAAIGTAPHGELVFAIDGWVEIPGAGLIGPSDVVGTSGGTYVRLFSGAAAGVPDGVAIDAIAYVALGGQQIGLSFDSQVTFGDETVRDTDIAYVLEDAFQFALPIGTVIPPGLDVDGLGGNGGLLGSHTFSFDGSGVLDGVAFDDEDILVLASGDWAMLVDGSTRHDALREADLTAFLLHLAYVFADGFETGDLVLWSSTTPP